MPNFTITEPHPTIQRNSYAHSGRGGAGNYFRAPVTTPASGVATVTTTTTTSQTASRFHSGRGGAGNAHVSAAKPVLSFDEEFAHQSHVEQKPIGYVGRGGAGNIYAANDVKPSAARKGSDASSQHSSSSTGSLSNIWSRLSHSRSRQ
ncbi:hypothetical protein F4820DRAFT_97623 [Hypoxylon rubiginosum]|uniref:Uncharacterized protein n=1 Tax=Hypoxylon rubiginosum TaxID=110542 RepID=A0ACB9YNV7_9PEZI|nr:hypothetical protein F4820DRAFT_97623 [Hypoxylon rubiginosum]